MVKRSIGLAVHCADLTRFDADVIALKYPRGLFGPALAVAAALGQTEAAMRQLLPSLGSAHLFPGQGRIRAGQALYLRVVELSAFDYSEIRQFSADVLRQLGKLAPSARHVAMTVHGTGFGLSTAKTVHAQVAGCLDALTAGQFPRSLAQLSIVERDESLAREIEEALKEILPEQRVEIAAPAEAEPEPAARRTVQDQAAYDVFISYKSEDTAPAQEVYEFLTARGVRTFFSRASLPQLGSDEYHERIDSAIEQTRHMVVVTSSGEHATAKWVRYEWRLFLGEKLAGRKSGNLVTVIAGGMRIDELPISLRHRQVVQFSPSELGRLLDYLTHDT